MVKQFLQLCVNALLTVLSKETIHGFIDAGLDALQKKAAETETTVDDELVIPACNLVRAALAMPGDVDVDAELKKLFTAIGKNYKVFIDAGLDYVEEKVEGSATELDDITVLPVCNMIRNVLNVPDND
jgi:hypothetical protein